MIEKRIFEKQKIKQMKNKGKQIQLLALGVFSLFMITSCGNEKKQSPETSENTEEIIDEQPIDERKEENAVSSNAFNIENIPVSDADLGDFPYFSFPKGMKSQNRPIQRDYDIIFFPIDGVMTPIEGKVFKVNVSLEDRKNDNWSLPFFLKSYDDAILSAGGQKIFDGKITREEYERYKDDAAYLGEDGSIGYTSNKIRVYVIRRADGKNIYIQLTGNTAGGKLNILQEEGFEQTITFLKSDQIQKDLQDKGKSVLYINFDTDKSTLKSDGKDAVNEIFKVLSADKTLQISINGYTDNTGNATHNQKLSEDRAKTVMKALVDAGIQSSRLTAQGFGAENPIADNNTEDGKAKNRRVELVKK